MPLIHTARSQPGAPAGLGQSAASHDPFDLFHQWFQEAAAAGQPLPEAMMLATAGRGGRPSARMVLLKQYDAGGFVFYTNSHSRKSEELKAHPFAALTFYWHTVDRQVRVEGSAEPVSEEEAAAYFSTRPRGSRIGAWASRQSARLTSKAALKAQVHALEARFEGKDVPLPPFWGGWRVAPSQVEFWQGRPSRLHDRLVFARHGDDWRTYWLYP